MVGRRFDIHFEGVIIMRQPLQLRGEIINPFVTHTFTQQTN